MAGTDAAPRRPVLPFSLLADRYCGGGDRLPLYSFGEKLGNEMNCSD